MIKLSPNEVLNSATNLTSTATSIESKITSLNAKYGSLYNKVKSRGSISSGVSKLREGTNILRSVSLSMKQLVVEIQNATGADLDMLPSSYEITSETLLTLGLMPMATEIETRKLEGEELALFMEDYHLADIETLTVSVETRVINGVPFEVYRVIDYANYNAEEYNTFINDSMQYIGNIPAPVLQYIQNSGTHIVYSSGYTVDEWCYTDGKFDESLAGWGVAEFNSQANGVNLIALHGNDEEDYEYNLHSSIHEFGHALAFAISVCEKTGDVNITSRTYNGLMENFYSIASDEVSKVDGDYDFSYYNVQSLVEEHHASEFFAEAFNAYYNMNPEINARYRLLLPDTFEYIDNLINSIANEE